MMISDLEESENSSVILFINPYCEAGPNNSLEGSMQML